jgi:hypothetical protein
MSRTNREPEYHRRIREKTEKDQQTAKTKRQESDNKYNTEKVTAAIKRVEEELGRTNNEQTPQKKRDRCWERFGFLGLWFAGFVGIAAICVGTHDASEQRGVMQGQLEIAQKTLVMTERPWLYVNGNIEFVVLNYRSGNDVTGFRVSTNIKNMGNAIAIDAEVNGVVKASRTRPDYVANIDTPNIDTRDIPCGWITPSRGPIREKLAIPPQKDQGLYFDGSVDPGSLVGTSRKIPNCQ